MDALKNTDWVDVVGSSTVSSVGTVVGGIVGFLIPIPGGTIIGGVVGGLIGDAVWSFGYDTYEQYGWKGVGVTALGWLAGLGLAPVTAGLSPIAGAIAAKWLYGKLWGPNATAPDAEQPTGPAPNAGVAYETGAGEPASRPSGPPPSGHPSIAPVIVNPFLIQP